MYALGEDYNVFSYPQLQPVIRRAVEQDRSLQAHQASAFETGKREVFIWGHSSHNDTTCVTTVCSSYSLDYLVHLVYFEAPVDWLLDHPAPKDDVLSSPGCRLSVGIRNIDIALSEHEERIH